MKNSKWLQEEIDILKSYYTQNGAKFCQEKLDRSLKSIRKKANEIGCTRFIGESRKDRYNKDRLTKIVSDSISIKEVLDAMGLRAAGGNYAVINKYIKLYSLNIEHFSEGEKLRREKLVNYSKNKKQDLSEILVENSSYNRTKLKERLYEEGLKKRMCEMPGCGQCEEWMGRKMSLILDHKNGIHNDNRIENLRIVCPNCNATLDTHCGKHKRKNMAL